MATRLHTAYGDEIRRIAQDDPERAAEMRMESQGYRDEIMGRLDEEFDPRDEMDCDGRDYDAHPDEGPDEDDCDGRDEDDRENDDTMVYNEP